MFDLIVQNLIDFANLIPVLTCVILVFNLCANMLFGKE